METSDYSAAGSGGIMALLGAFALVYLAILVLMVISFWKIFTKAGKPGWAAIIPIYNLVVFLEIVNKPVWWIILILIPIVNIVILIILTHRLSLSFGQSTGFTILLLFVGIVGYPLLAFGDYKYVGPLKD
jgi:ABC-type Na+ efflux pump permease subunit